MLCRKTGCCKGQLTAAGRRVSLLISECTILPLSVDAYLTSVYIFCLIFGKLIGNTTRGVVIVTEQTQALVLHLVRYVSAKTEHFRTILRS